MVRTAGGAVAAAPGDASADAELMVIHFRPFTKLTRKASLPWLWKLNDNVIVTATITPKREADAMIAAAAAAAAASETGVAAVNPPTVAAAAAGVDVAASAASGAAAVSSSSSSSSAAPAAAAGSSGVAALPAAHPSFTLTIREFYNLFLYYCDNVSQAATLRDQILKLEDPSAWQAKQDARRKECTAQLQQQQQQQSTPGQGGGADAEQKEEKSAESASAAAAAELQSAASSSSPLPCKPSLSRTGSAVQDCSVAECCICLNVPGENGLGQELVVLSCVHAFCEECLEQWRQQSATCPLCRRELDEQPEEDDSSWILTSHDLAQLRSQHQKLLEHPFAVVQARPTFPPKDNRKGVKNAGDAFSLVVGEVLDVLTPPVRRPHRQVAAAGPGAEVPVPVAVPVRQQNDVQIPVAMPVAKTQAQTDPEPQL